MAKFFAIYTNVNITEKPDWLDSFRSKYDLEYHADTDTFDIPYEAHITLTQPRFITDYEATKLRAELTKFFKDYSGKIEVEFSGLHLDRQDANDNGCIMVDSTDRDELSKLQSKMLDFVSENDNFCDIMHKAYEDNFIPHLTIGRDLSKGKFDDAIAGLPDEIRIKATVSEVILAIVPDESAAERKDPKNLTIYHISNNLTKIEAIRLYS
jgi:2'-5' RNA ligase